MNNVTFLKPEHLAPVRNLTLRTRLIVEGMIAGLHKSPYHGFSAEFLEYRPYQAGEAAGSIDWRKYAKTDRSYVRLYEDETNCFAHILVDKSASMGFTADGRMTKFDYARTLAASVAWILIRQRDAVALAAFDEKVTTYLPPRSTNLQLKNILTVLDSLQAGARTRCGVSVDLLARSIRRRGITILLSDLFDEPAEILQGLRHLRYKKQDVLLIWILDPQECRFTSRRTYLLDDIETGRTLRLDGKTAARFLKEGVTGHRETVARACRELSIDFATVMTDEPFVQALLRVLQTRRRLF